MLAEQNKKSSPSDDVSNECRKRRKDKQKNVKNAKSAVKDV